jgi:uncharacterized protein with GYD domain
MRRNGIQAFRDLAKKMGIEMKQCSNLAAGDRYLVTIASPKLAFGAVGNVRARNQRAWPEAEISQDRFRVALSRAGLVARPEPGGRNGRG